MMMMFFFKKRCARHDMEPILFPTPPFESTWETEDPKLFDIVPTSIMCCRSCWQLEAWTQKVEGDVVRMKIQVLNRGTLHLRKRGTPNRLIEGNREHG